MYLTFFSTINKPQTVAFNFVPVTENVFVRRQRAWRRFNACECHKPTSSAATVAMDSCDLFAFFLAKNVAKKL